MTNIDLAHCATESTEHGEHRDCTVRALATACNVPYSDAHAALKAWGRPDRQGAHHWRQPYAEFGKTLIDMTDQFKGRTITSLSRELAKRPHSVYVVEVRGHVATFKDGEWQDWLDTDRRHRVRRVYQVITGLSPDITPDRKPCAYTYGTDRMHTITKRLGA